jgi:dipeptide/tripeptide permease
MFPRPTRLSLWLLANACLRVPFFCFKFTGVFYCARLLESDAAGRYAFAWTIGLSYLLPLLWSHRINSLRAQRMAVGGGALLLALSFGAFYFRTPIWLSGTLFCFGHGLLNANYKALFANSLKNDEGSSSAGFTWLVLCSNLAAAAAGFISAIPTQNGIIGISVLYGYGAAAVALFGFLVMELTRGSRAADVTERNPVADTPHQPGGAVARSRSVVLLAVVLIATIFWTLFEVRPMALNQLAKDALCPVLWGLTLHPTYLQAVNPISYLVFAPLFSWVLKTFPRFTPHPLYMMGSGAILMGLGFLIFSRLAGIGAGACIEGSVFIGLYVLQTVAELLLEPIGLSFIARNSTMRSRSFLFVLWEASSGIAYICGGLIVIESFSLVGAVAVAGGLLFVVVVKKLKQFVL